MFRSVQGNDKMLIVQVHLGQIRRVYVSLITDSNERESDS